MKYSLIVIGLLFVIYPIWAQSPEEVVNQFLNRSGGKERWVKLKSRKATGKVIMQSSSTVGFSEEYKNFSNYYLAPSNYMRAWITDLSLSVRSYTESCNWYYTDQSMTISFYGSKYNKSKAKLPQVNILEILTFPMIDSLIIEPKFYRVDFEDKIWNRVISVYFDNTSYLVSKHSYVNAGESSVHEYLYSNYKVNQGLLEAYQIDKYVDGSKSFSMQIAEIQYGIPLNKNMFKAPVKCNQKDFMPIKLDRPLVINEQ